MKPTNITYQVIENQTTCMNQNLLFLYSIIITITILHLNPRDVCTGTQSFRLTLFCLLMLMQIQAKTELSLAMNDLILF